MQVIAEVDPEPARGLDLPLRVPHLHRRVVGVNRAAQEDQRLHQVVQRLERLGGTGHPVAEGRARQLHPLAGEPAFLAIERDMVGILFGDHMSEQSRPGQALLDRLGGLAGRDDLALAVRAGVRAAHVLDHEQGRRLVVELLAALRADLDSALATLRAAALGFGQLVDPRHAPEILGQGPAAVGARLLRWGRARLGLGRDRVGRFRGLRGHRLEGVGNEQGLIGVEAFGAGAVEPPQEEVEAVLQLLVLASRVAERVEQFEDHLLEDGGIVGQRRRGIGGGLGGGGAGVFAHALLDV